MMAENNNLVVGSGICSGLRLLLVATVSIVVVAVVALGLVLVFGLGLNSYTTTTTSPTPTATTTATKNTTTTPATNATPTTTATTPITTTTLTPTTTATTPITTTTLTPTTTATTPITTTTLTPTTTATTPITTTTLTPTTTATTSITTTTLTPTTTTTTTSTPTTTTTTTTTSTTTTTPPTPLTNIVFQRRIYGNVSFAKDWVEYENGFGDVHGDFWLGLKKLRELTKHGQYKLRMEAMKFNNDTLFYATYNTFIVGPSTDGYRLNVSGFHLALSNFDAETLGGTAKPNMGFSNTWKFSTRDVDNDNWTFWTNGFDNGGSCSSEKCGSAGWWFNACTYVNPNGILRDSRVLGDGKSVYWTNVDSHNALKFFRMLLVV